MPQQAIAQRDLPGVIINDTAQLGTLVSRAAVSWAELAALATAFTTGSPDSNGKADSSG